VSVLGETIDDRYRIVRKLGAGGMAVVYAADDLALSRRVAIKVVRDDLPSQHLLLERFLREARIAAKLEHPNVVRVLDLGRLDSGRPYLVLEHVEGTDLADELGSIGVLAPERAMRVVRQLACGVDAMHAAGIVHRDLKPENVLLCRDSSHGTAHGEVAKIVDFGLALSTGVRRLTAPGMMIGTIGYMPPEACCAGTEVDRRGDVYAVGVLAFEVLIGHLPYDDRDVPTMLAQKQLGDHEPVSAVVPQWAPLDRVFDKVLSPDPCLRHATARQFVDDLELAWTGRSRERVSREVVTIRLTPALAKTLAMAAPADPAE
jgi:serine/threonine-protein kinase